MLAGAFFVWEAVFAGFSDWQYAVLLALCAACFLAGGGLILITVLEIQ